MPGWILGAWQLRGRRMDADVAGGVGWRTLVFVPVVALGLYVALHPAGMLWPGEPNAYDVRSYHLQLPREWLDLGRVVPLHHNVYSFFPLGVEMHYLVGMQLMGGRGGAWSGSYVAQFMHLAMFWTAGAAMYALVRGMGHGLWAALGAAAVVVGSPYVMQLGGIAYNEGGEVLYGVLSLGLLLGPRRGRAALLAGVCAGLGAGVKLTAVPLLIGGGIAFLLVVREWRRVGWFLAGGVIAFLPWAARTAAWTGGNPVFPVAMRVLGTGHFTPAQVDRFERAHSPREDQGGLGGRLHAFWDQIGGAAEFGYVLMPGALIAGAWGMRSREGRGLMAIFLVHVGIWLFATHLQGRFFVGAVPVMAAILARARWGYVAGLAAMGVGIALVALRLLGSPVNGLAGIELNDPGVQRALMGDAMAAIPHDRVLTLVGNGGPYLIFRPMSQLKYATPFDAIGDDVRSAWRTSPGDAVWVDPSEVRRLAHTYHTPALPAEWDRGDEGFLADPGTPRP